jgi:hypothetical protein
MRSDIAMTLTVVLVKEKIGLAVWELTVMSGSSLNALHSFY